MPTATLSLSSTIVSQSCGSWGGATWGASGCALNTWGKVVGRYTNTIPLGSRITAISSVVNAYSPVVASAYPGEMIITNKLTNSSLLGATTLNKSDTGYLVSESGLNVLVTGIILDILEVTILNKETYHDSNHYAYLYPVDVTYTLPPSQSLFFGSNF